tara:strand:+ start:1232 stop:1432 length:201 start_codon:yes stop_codon:yes gene_type:complete
LNHILFNGLSNFEFSKPKIKKIIEITKDQILISALFNIGHKVINKKISENTKPKLLFELILIFIIF